MATKREYRNDDAGPRSLYGFLTLGTHSTSSDVAFLKMSFDASVAGRPIWFSMIFFAGLTEKPMHHHPREVWQKRSSSFAKMCSLAGIDPWSWVLLNLVV